MNKRYINILKLIAGIGLLTYIIFYKTEPEEIFRVLKRTSPILAVISFLLHAIGIYLSALRWKLLLNEKDDGYTTSYLCKSYLVFNFFSLFLPRFGGDVSRIADTRKTEKGLVKSAAVVFVERLSGLFILVLFGLVISIIKFEYVVKVPQILYPISIFSIGIFFFIILWKWVPPDLITRIDFRIAIFNRIGAKISQLHLTINESLSNTKLIVKATMYSMLLQFNVVLHYYLIGKALKIDIPITDYFYIMPILMILLAFPISPPNGLGLKEFVLAEFFILFNYGYAHVVSFSVLDTFFNLILGVLGGFIYFSRKQ